MVIRKGFIFLSLILSISSFAQDALPIPVNIKPSYDAGIRTLDGKPGAKYWQNTAEYNIAVNFNPSTLLLRGAEVILYTNNSPDTLNEIVFKIYPNLYKKGAQRTANVQPEDIGDGLIIDRISIPDNPVLTYSYRGTNMLVSIPPLLPKESIILNVGYHYTLNRTSHIRTGEVEPNAAFVAYFFPRIAVYDDIDGWNEIQYLGRQEFYNDFCNFRVAVTVPKNFVVWATGDLTNCNDVLNGKYCALINQALANDSVTTIIDTTDLTNQNITKDTALNTFRFSADNVTDFVFATSDHYVWKSSGITVDSATERRVRVDAAFNPNRADYYDVVKYNRETVKSMSFTFPKWPFPYSHETVFQGLDQMEYPMMVNDNPVESSFDAITLTDHEVFHTMFPFYTGINETKYAWMDEGWATLGEWLISPMIDSTIIDTYGMKDYESFAGVEADVPITTLTTELSETPMFINSYIKPALAYLYIKNYLGDELFTKALHYYIGQWQGKHPLPNDFFNCMNTGSGKNLNWFWKRWFFETGVPDLAINKVKKSGRKYKVTIESKGSKPVPIDLHITLTDGNIIKEHRSIKVWEKGDTRTTLKFRPNKKVSKITLGSTYTADINKGDNTWTEK